MVMADEEKAVIDGCETARGQFHEIERVVLQRPEMSGVMWVAKRLEVAESFQTPTIWSIGAIDRRIRSGGREAA